jgi:class 3 adenylate cyclase
MSDRPISELNTRAYLEHLLDELAEHPERIEDVTERVDEAFAEERTVLILDMSGFTRATRQGDLISYLLMINQMRRLALPVVQEHGGILVRADHDNLTCLFDDVPSAVEASQDITRRLETVNVVLPSDRELYVSIGIGHGRILNVENESVYGSEVNLASKLGEDIAQLGEILLTEGARAALGEGARCVEHVVSLSGMELRYFSVDI